MKSPFAIAVWMVLASVLLKMIVFVNGWQFNDYGRVAFFGNVFILMIGVYLSLRLYKRTIGGVTTFFDDFRAAMRFVGLYAILMTAFVYIYYAQIDTAYFDTKLKDQLTLAAEHEMDLEQVKKTGEMVFTPFFQSTVTLMGFLILGSFYSAIITFLTRKTRAYGEKKV